MEFWEKHDFALMKVSGEMISLIEEYNKTHDINGNNYHKNLDSFLKRKIGKKVDMLTKLSLLKTIISLKQDSHKFALSS